MALSSHRKRVNRYKQKLRQEVNRTGSRFPKTQDPRGPPSKKATHSYLDINEMPHVVWRAIEVQKLLEQDATGLHAYEAPQLVCPLKFEVIRSAAELKKKELDACLSLVERTSGNDYKTSSVGWNPRKKKTEMMDKEMIYLLVRQGDVGEAAGEMTQDGSEKGCPDMEGAHASLEPHLNPLEQVVYGYASDSEEEDVVDPKQTVQHEDIVGMEDARDGLFHDPGPSRSAPVKELEWPDPRNNGSILGFTSFMFTYDDPPHEDRQVVYIYEIHLNHRLRGRGLGSALIKFIENAAEHCGVSKTMLTVFTANTGAMALYEKLGYGKDDCSPKDRAMRNKIIKPDYMIMSKELA